MKVLKYKDFLNEDVSEFGFQQFGLGGVGGNPAVAPKDPQTSLDAWDRFKEHLREQLARLQSILQIVFNQYAGNTMKDADFWTFEDVNIINIFYKNDNYVDIYIKLTYDSETYYMCLHNYGTEQYHITGGLMDLVDFKFDKTNAIKLKGILKKCLDKWFMPDNTEYFTLRSIKTWDYLGNIKYLPEGSKVKVDRVSFDDQFPCIDLIYNEEKLYFTGLDYYNFNYWFKEIKNTQKFYI